MAPDIGQSLAEYLALCEKPVSTCMSELIRGPASPEVEQLTAEVNCVLRGSQLLTAKDVWEMITAGGTVDLPYDRAMNALRGCVEEWKRLHHA